MDLVGLEVGSSDCEVDAVGCKVVVARVSLRAKSAWTKLRLSLRRGLSDAARLTANKKRLRSAPSLGCLRV